MKKKAKKEEQNLLEKNEKELQAILDTFNKGNKMVAAYMEKHGKHTIAVQSSFYMATDTEVDGQFRTFESTIGTAGACLIALEAQKAQIQKRVTRSGFGDFLEDILG